MYIITSIFGVFLILTGIGYYTYNTQFLTNKKKVMAEVVDCVSEQERDILTIEYDGYVSKVVAMSSSECSKGKALEVVYELSNPKEVFLMSLYNYVLRICVVTGLALWTVFYYLYKGEEKGD